VAAPQPIALVHLERHAGGGIGERGPERIGAHPLTEQGRPALARPLGGELGEAPVLGQRAARDDGAERVEQHQPRGGERRGGGGLGGGARGGGGGGRRWAAAGAGGGEPIEVVVHDGGAPALADGAPDRGERARAGEELP